MAFGPRVDQQLLLSAPFDAVTSHDLRSIHSLVPKSRPRHQGTGENDQVNVIFKLVGTPSESSWPEFAMLPGVASGVFTIQVTAGACSVQMYVQGSACAVELSHSSTTYAPTHATTHAPALAPAHAP
eukprot:5361036-Pleurochrysis_carterae.AAC.1